VNVVLRSILLTLFATGHERLTSGCAMIGIPYSVLSSICRKTPCPYVIDLDFDLDVDFDVVVNNRRAVWQMLYLDSLPRS
jgi:hypothetical protein